MVTFGKLMLIEEDGMDVEVTEVKYSLPVYLKICSYFSRDQFAVPHRPNTNQKILLTHGCILHAAMLRAYCSRILRHKLH